MPVSARAAGLAVLMVAAPPAAAPVPAASARLERASPFYRAARFVAPSAATFAAPAETSGIRPAGIQAAPPAPPRGRLPNQRTGPRRDHPVRDICIGC